MGVKLVKENKLLAVILISFVVIGAVILTNFFSFSIIESTVINQLKDKQQIETEYSASQIENHIYQVRDELTALSKFPIMENLDVNKCSGDMKIVHQAIEGKISSLLRVDKAGKVIECSSPDFSNYVGLNIKNKDYFKVPKETNEPFIAGLVRQGTNQQIIISAPLFETTEYTPYPNFIGEFKGVLLSIIELNDLYNLYLHPIIDTDKSFFLLINLDTEDTILKSSDIDDYSAIKSSLPINIDNPRIIDDFNTYGKTVLTYSNLILGSETWRLIILTPLKNVGGEIESVQKRHLFTLGFVAIVVISVFFFMIFLYKSKEEVQEQLKKANITLEKFGINIGIEKDKYTQADISLDTKKVYLVKEDDENNAHELFISTLNRGFAGLGIVRDDPRQIKKKYNLEKTSFIWLTKTKIEKIPCETNIDNLFELISEFVKKSKKSVVLLDRLDYILTENKFEDVIKRIHALKDLALGHECIVILSLNPELVEESKLKAIEAETIDLYGKHLRKKVELSNLEMDILKYINEKNVTNKLASYKDITDNFKITKPTTRVKINKLQGLGLLNVEQKGRFKTLKVTSAGRRIIG
jgi:DNA-binding MarR family transcriptional regulator